MSIPRSLQLPQLADDNRPDWFTLLKLFLRSEGLWTIVEGSRRRPETPKLASRAQVASLPVTKTFSYNVPQEGRLSSGVAKQAQHDDGAKLAAIKQAQVLWDKDDAKAMLHIYAHAGYLADTLLERVDSTTSNKAWYLLDVWSRTSGMGNANDGGRREDTSSRAGDAKLTHGNDWVAL